MKKILLALLITLFSSSIFASDEKPGRFFEDQPDVTDDYQIHFIYMLTASDKDRELDINGKIEEYANKMNALVEKFSKKTKGSSGEKKLTIALGYGGRQEILDAVKSLIKEKYEISNSLDEAANHITDTDITKHLYSPNLPDIDLIIRTSGEAISNGYLY